MRLLVKEKIIKIHDKIIYYNLFHTKTIKDEADNHFYRLTSDI